MPRLSLKPDSSFFRKIVVGAVGARAVCDDMALLGHEFVELERGSTDSKLWKDVKRKRVRIPDLVCLRCGQRIECRAKTKNELAMSHSEQAERTWDYGMVPQDWIAFPVCKAINEAEHTVGRLADSISYWHERDWVQWQVSGYINYFSVDGFRSCLHTRSRTKGVTEGSENFVSWDATFSSRCGPVLSVDEASRKVKIGLEDGSRPHTWSIPKHCKLFVLEGDTVKERQIIAASVPPLHRDDLACPNVLPDKHIDALLSSRERTQRFTGIKLARILKLTDHESAAQELANDAEEDVYVRLEAASYLVSCCATPAEPTFRPYIDSGDPQTQLEAVIALGDAGTPDSVALLSNIISSGENPYFLMSAAAWSLGHIGSTKANDELVHAFASVDDSLRYEALENLVGVGCSSCDNLMRGLNSQDKDIVAGCAEALRQQERLPRPIIDGLLNRLKADEPNGWVVWLVSHLPREQVNTAIAELQRHSPELHYAVTLIWSFLDSWIAKHWELRPSARFPCDM
ncbi:MAG: HEAT repeat domain-containing protein [Pirellulales bacterium]|nr:HEAT repeat domain-containing protein [Pirellulales bacterium]